MNMNNAAGVTPTGYKNHRDMSKLVCFACCFGSFTENTITKNNNDVTREATAEFCNCCWLLGFCQTISYEAHENDVISSESKTSYYGCCFCWDPTGAAYFCGFPLN